MLPGKKYTPSDYGRIVWNRKAWIIVPAVVIGVATAAWVYNLPNRYRAQTTIVIVPQRVPENYVRPTVTSEVSERLQLISQQILSRTRLERLIQEFRLYNAERQAMTMEDVVALMRKDIRVDINQSRRRRNDEATSFTVGYESQQPRAAMQVAERLASLFVEENLQDRELLADATSQFLGAQLEDARGRLLEHEKKLQEFRRRYSGQLPSQSQSNLQMMQTAQNRLQILAEGSYRDRDRLAAVEAALADAASVAPAAPRVAVRGGDVLRNPNTRTPEAVAAQQLEAARSALRDLEVRLKPVHPDVIRAKKVVSELEAKVNTDSVPATPVPGDSPDSVRAAIPAVGVAPPAVESRVASLRLEAEELRRRVESRRQEEADLQKRIVGYTRRLEATPAVESQLTELMRDYSTLQDSYTSLLTKSEASKVAVNLERRQIGEQFKILEGARLPERPISPDRLRLHLMGLAAGLAFGLALLALIEYRDTTLKSDDDIVVSLALPVLAVVPMMMNVRERNKAIHRRVLLATSASVAVLVGVAAALWKLGFIMPWVR
jgi:protein tyrosine kinase modulator